MLAAAREVGERCAQQDEGHASILRGVGSGPPKGISFADVGRSIGLAALAELGTPAFASSAEAIGGCASSSSARRRRHHRRLRDDRRRALRLPRAREAPLVPARARARRSRRSGASARASTRASRRRPCRTRATCRRCGRTGSGSRRGSASTGTSSRSARATSGCPTAALRDALPAPLASRARSARTRRRCSRCSRACSARSSGASGRRPSCGRRSPRSTSRRASAIELAEELRHELRAPLQVIDGYAEAMLDGVVAARRRARALVRREAGRAHAAARRPRRPRAPRGARRASDAPPSRRPPTRSPPRCASASLPLAESAGVELVADVAPARSRIPRKRLEQLVVNLVRNALRAVAGGRRHADRRSSCGRGATASSVGVEDDGPGIAERRAAARLRALLPRQLSPGRRERQRARADDRAPHRRGGRRRDRRRAASSRTGLRVVARLPPRRAVAGGDEAAVRAVAAPRARSMPSACGCLGDESCRAARPARATSQSADARRRRATAAGARSPASGRRRARRRTRLRATRAHGTRGLRRRRGASARRRALAAARSSSPVIRSASAVRSDGELSASERTRRCPS